MSAIFLGRNVLNALVAGERNSVTLVSCMPGGSRVARYHVQALCVLISKFCHVGRIPLEIFIV